MTLAPLVESDTLYKKTISKKGRVRYVPVAEHFGMEALPKGTWIVTIRPGGAKTAVRAAPNDDLEVASMMETARSFLLDALMEASRKRPGHRGTEPLLQKEKEAWETYSKAMREQGLDPMPITLTVPSAWDVVDRAIEELKRHYKESHEVAHEDSR